MARHETPEDILRNAAKTIGELNTVVLDRINEFNARLDGFETVLKRPPDFGASNNQDLRKALDAIGKFARTGDLSALSKGAGGFNNVLQVGDDTLGGYLETPAVSPVIKAKLFDSSPMRGLVRVVTIGNGSSFQEPIDNSDCEARWSGETESRPELSAGTFGLSDIPLSEEDTVVKVTPTLLEDSKYDVGGYIVDKISARFGRQEDAAIVSGDGIKKPKGFLSYSVSSATDSSRASNTFQYVASGAATSVTADSIINLFYSLRAPYRQNATFVMNSDTARQVRVLKSGDGSYLWSPSLAAGTPDTLLGKPVVYDENMPAVGAGTFPIAVADWKKAYTAIERDGLKFIHDPYSQKPFVLIYARRRFGGQASGDFDALKLMKIATS